MILVTTESQQHREKEDHDFLGVSVSAVKPSGLFPLALARTADWRADMRWAGILSLMAVLGFVFSFGRRSAWAQSPAPVGIFEGHGDVGTVLHPGSVDYDSAKRTYTVAGSGENMWLAADAFQFAWKKMSGDVEITADVQFANLSGNEHKKAVLMFRQSLEPDSVYADVALHASGLLSLQYREEKGATTHEVQSGMSLQRLNVVRRADSDSSCDLAPPRLRLTRRGAYVYVSVAPPCEVLAYNGEAIRIGFDGEFYVGIGVCSHNKDAVEQATFSNVKVESVPASVARPDLYSTLEAVDIKSTDRRVLYFSKERLEAPNWAHDDSYILFNRNGRLEKLPLTGTKQVLEIIDTGFATRCNNDHGISPDATQLAISDNSQEDHESLVYIVPIAGGVPRRITQKSPSYWHGWSPDGKTLAFVGRRNDDFDIYTIPAAGGEEMRLTTAKGLDDGPEYSPDGKYIYFNSERTGHMQIWRMKPDGSEQEQVFSDDLNNWFPHISPDGQWMVFLTYDASVTGHPENKDVMLRLMPLTGQSGADKKITVLARLFGGQGTINVPSWSPDSKRVAFVSYALIP